MDASLLLSVISILFASISLIFTYLKFGLEITLDFAGKSDVRNYQNTAETCLRDELNNEIEKFFTQNKGKTIESRAIQELDILGQKAHVCNLPSQIIEKISEKTNYLFRQFIFLLIGLIMLISTYFLSGYEIPNLSRDSQTALLLILFGVGGFYFFNSLIEEYRAIKNITDLKNLFYKITNKPNLNDLLKIYDEIKDEKLQ